MSAAPARTAACAAQALTAEQQQPVERRGEPLLLSAGAGSGKTAVLVERFVRAVCEDGVAPAQILAITFTERAAGELRARVRRRLLELGARAAARDTEAAFVGTFHAFCARLMRAHARLLELDPDFAILEESLAARLRADAFARALRAFLRGERADAVELVAAYEVDRVRTMIEGAFLALRSRGQRAPALPAPALPAAAGESDREAARACALLGELLIGFGRAYEQLKRARGAVDFDDLELLAGELLAGRERLRGVWSARFALLMVDEFQDTNPRQLHILRALERGNLFTVGDEFQAIYGFRHADVQLFRERRSELQGRGASLALTCNFRSRGPLLDVVNAVFKSRFDGYTALVAARGEAPPDGARAGEPPAQAGEPAVELLLSTTRGWEEHEQLAAALGRGMPPAPLWRQAEAHLLARRVSELIAGGQVRAGDVAVLLRAAGDLDVYERALSLRGLRTAAAAGGFWARQQVRDLLAYLAAFANPGDERALYATLASPLAGCSPDTLAQLAQAARAGGRGSWETALRAGAQPQLLADLPSGERARLAGFCARLQREREHAARRPIAELIARAVGASGYGEHVLSLECGERRLANVHKLMRVARRFEASEGRSLRAFLDHAAHLADAASAVEPDAPVEGAEPDAVRLMTIHAAKGLEFPVVCVADLGRAQGRRIPDLLVDGERIGLRLARLGGERTVPALDYEALCARRARAEDEEEDRIVYVAMTRARELLLLSGAVDFKRWPEQRERATAISWLGLSLAAELPALAAASRPAPLDLHVGSPGAGRDARVRCRFSVPEHAAQLLGLSDLHGAPHGEPAGPAPGAAGVAAAGTSAPAQAPTAAPAPSDSRRAPAGQISVLSYTTLGELERCGYRHYLERVLALGEDRRPARSRQRAPRSLSARDRGTLLHRLLEQLDFRAPTLPAAHDLDRRARELGLRVDARAREEICALLAAATAAAPARRVAAAVSVRREQRFALVLRPGLPLLTGVIDLVAREAHGRSLVLDYKSDRLAAETRAGALVEREYELQRLLYALAVLRCGARSVEVIHWFLERPEEWVGARYSAAERPSLERLLAARCERALANRLAVSSKPHRGLCLSCPGRSALCSWSERDTLRDEPAA